MYIIKNEHLSSRISSIFNSLEVGFEAGATMSSASKGVERELIVSTLFREIFPPHFRFSSGDITDSNNQKSGQVDIVLEYAHGFSFPMLSGGPRLFLSENVAAVIEVKSDVAGQWDEVCETATKVKNLERKFAHQRFTEFVSGIQSGAINANEQTLRLLQQATKNTKGKGESKIPFYAIGFNGWKKKETIEQKVQSSNVDGVFVVKEKISVGPTGTTTGLNSMLAFIQAIESDFKKETMTLGATSLYQI